MTRDPPAKGWRLLGAWMAWLATKRGRAVSVFCGVLLAAPAIGPRLVLDDFVLGLVARATPAIPGLAQNRFDLFTFTTGHPRDNTALMDQGIMLPWWTEPDLKIAFCRPVSSLTHRLDFAAFPNSPPLFYLHSLVWLTAMLIAVAALYRRLESTPAIAGLALWCYAVDDASATVVSWAANRNALIATALGCAAISAHDAYRRTRGIGWAVVSPACLLVGLLAGEFALGAVAYLVAYAVCIERGSWRSRFASIVPQGAVTVLWLVTYRAAGCGAAGSGAYIDPAHDPLAFATAAPLNALALLHGAWSLPPSDLVFLGPPADRPILLAIAGLTVVLVWFAAWPSIKADRTARFWAIGMVVSSLPVAASFPSDRLLLFVSLGAMGLFSRMFEAFVRTRAAGLRMTARDAAIALFAIVELIAAPLLRPARAAQMQLFAAALDSAEQGLFPNGAPLAKTLVIVNAPTLLFSDYIQAERAYFGEARPQHLYVLASASSELKVRRTGERELTVSAADGFLSTPLERHYRRHAAMPVGTAVELSAMTATIAAVRKDGRPSAVRFAFEESFGSGGLAFARWSGNRYVPFEPPALDAMVTMPAEDFGRILLERSLHR